MSRRKYTPEQILSKLREVEVTLAQGATVPLDKLILKEAAEGNF
jgi:hypothetical protein